MLTQQNKNRTKQKQLKNMFTTFTVTFMFTKVAATKPSVLVITEYLDACIVSYLAFLGD